MESYWDQLVSWSTTWTTALNYLHGFPACLSGPNAAGKALELPWCVASLDEATSLHVSKLYLYTVDSTAFYANLGWSLLEHTAHRGKEISIMSYSTIATTP